MTLKYEQDEEFRNACTLVESRCRQLGKDCQVIFMAKGGVRVAPLSWAGDSNGRTLYDAIMDAESTDIINRGHEL